jgi:hypothetical protein
MLTGERPFRGALTGTLAGPVTRAMARRPHDRYVSAREFAHAIAHPQAAVDTPTESLTEQPEKTQVLPIVREPDATPRKARQRDRQRAWVFGLIAATALLTGGLLAAQHRDSTPSRPPVQPAASVPQDVQAKIDALQHAVDR